MWIARDKNGTLKLHKTRPYRLADYWTSVSTLGTIDITDLPEFEYLTWDDLPVEVDLITVKDLLATRGELKDVYHKLLNYQTAELNDLTAVYRGVALEEFTTFINNVEDKILTKFEMRGNSRCSKAIRGVTIADSTSTPSDNSLREYLIGDRVVATIYVRRNDFNSIDIIVSDLGTTLLT